jgi:low temperature requirement protein LtrA
MPRSLLRDRFSHAEARVTFVELFFDLVFVFAITQLSHHLLEHLGPAGVLETGILLLAVWTVWVYTIWATNWLDTRHAPVRAAIFALMAAGLVVSTSLPDAFGSRGLVFALAYAVMQNGRNLFTLWCIGSEHPPSFRSFLRIQVWLSIAAVFWIAGGLASGAARMTWWAIALALEFGSPWWRYWTPGLGASTIADWRVSPHHFAERCGLFVIIALGESVLVTGATFARLEWSAPVVAAFFAAFTGSVAMWWVYFATTADEASDELAAREDPGSLARGAYTYSHLPLVAGIIVAAVSDELVLAHPLGHTEVAVAAATIGGPLLFLAGSALFNRQMCAAWPRSHVAGVALLMATAAIASVAPPVVLSALTTAALVVVGAWETLTRGGANAVRNAG